MHTTKKVLMAVAALAALGLGGSAIAGAVSGGSGTDASDSAVPDAAAQRARAVALKAAGGATTGDVESDGEHNAAYAVEVTRPDGREMEVRLGPDFKVLSVAPDAADDHGGETNDTESGD